VVRSMEVRPAEGIGCRLSCDEEEEDGVVDPFGRAVPEGESRCPPSTDPAVLPASRTTARPAFVGLARPGEI
jgi:hypothetical protein